jgi:hypothetical protein
MANSVGHESLFPLPNEATRNRRYDCQQSVAPSLSFEGAGSNKNRKARLRGVTRWFLLHLVVAPSLSSSSVS